MAIDLLDRIWKRVEKRADGCWVFTGARSKKGYGVIREGARGTPLIYVHRTILRVKLGREIQSGMKALHTCDNRPCCNPEHVYEGTSKQNSEDMAARGRWRNQHSSGPNAVERC